MEHETFEELGKVGQTMDSDGTERSKFGLFVALGFVRS